VPSKPELVAPAAEAASHGRVMQRSLDNPARRVHADPAPGHDFEEFARQCDAIA
jgi:hypothetical protein